MKPQPKYRLGNSLSVEILFFSNQRFIYLALFAKILVLYRLSCLKLQNFCIYFVKPKGSLKKLNEPKPRYGPCLFSLICSPCSPLLKDPSFVFIHLFYPNIPKNRNHTATNLISSFNPETRKPR